MTTEDAEYAARKTVREEKKRKSGAYWLTQEGRQEIEGLWPDGEDIPGYLLTHIEKLEAANATLLAYVDCQRAWNGYTAWQDDRPSCSPTFLRHGWDGLEDALTWFCRLRAAAYLLLPGGTP